MSATQSIEYIKEGDRQIFNLNLAGQDPLVLDFTGVPDDQRGGTAKKLLAASASSCFCSALGAALKARGANCSRIVAETQVTTGADEQGKVRVQKLEMKITVHMQEEDEDILERCIKIMKQGCLVTASLEAAFPVTYEIVPEFD